MTGNFVTTCLMIAAVVAWAQYAPLPKHSHPFNLRFLITWLVNEQPFLGMWWLIAGTAASLTSGQIDGVVAWLVALGLLVLAAGALIILIATSLDARPTLTAALAQVGAQPLRTNPWRLPWLRIVVLFFVAWRPDVRRSKNLPYGTTSRAHRLDVYTSRRATQDAPVLIYFHGGALRMGSKLLGGRPLIYQLASRGWVCISADYRLRPGTRYADQIDDARAVIDWVRTNVSTYGGNAHAVVLAGASAGASLAATAGLTDRDLDRPLAGVIGLYGYYGQADGSSDHPSSPSAYVHAGAPPFFIIHGSRDTAVIAPVARAFAASLTARSAQPVVYAELPGAQHNFDFFHSLRIHAVIDAIEGFATGVCPSSSRPSEGAADL